MESKNQKQIRAILNRSPRTTMRMYEFLDLLNEDWVRCYVNNMAVLFVTWAIMPWADSEEDLIPLLKHIPTDQPEAELFCVEKRLIPLLERYVAPVTVEHDCYVWTLDRLSKEPLALDSLTLKDAPFVNDHWAYKHEESLNFIQHCIQTMPTSCVRGNDGRPVAMAFCYGQSPEYINMGGFQVFPEHQRRGLGMKVHLDICQKVLARHRKPLVHIKVDNAVSQHICEKTGFKRSERVFWGKLHFRK